MARLWSTTLLAAALGTLSQTAGGQPSREFSVRLLLREQLSVPLPDTMSISGGALGPSGAAVLWSTGLGVVVAVRGGSLTALCPTSRMRPVGARMLSDDVVEIVDANGPSLIRVEAGRCAHTPMRHRALINTVTFSNDDWLISGITAGGSPFVATMRDNRSSSPLRTFIRDSSRSAAMHLTGGRRAVASMLRPPFAWRATLEGGGFVDGAPPAQAVAKFAGASTSSVLGLPVRTLGNGYLQILSDLTSDRRLLVTYRADGSFSRADLVEASMGVLDVNETDKVLLAIRRSDRLELVTYSWQWQP